MLCKYNRVEVGEYKQFFRMLLRDRLDLIIGKSSVGISFMKENKDIRMISNCSERKLKEDGILKKIENNIRKELIH